MAVPRGPTTRQTGYWERVYRIPCCPLDRSRSFLHGQCVRLHLVGLRRSLVRIMGENVTSLKHGFESRWDRQRFEAALARARSREEYLALHGQLFVERAEDLVDPGGR